MGQGTNKLATTNKSLPHPAPLLLSVGSGLRIENTTQRAIGSGVGEWSVLPLCNMNVEDELAVKGNDAVDISSSALSIVSPTTLGGGGGDEEGGRTREQ